MKKVVSVLAIAMITVMLCMSLTACGAISGTYGDASGVAGVEYKFSGNNVEVTFGIAGFTKTSKGTYKVEKTSDGSKITFTFEDSDASKYQGTYSFNSGKDDKGEYIVIGGGTYYKKK